MADELKSPIFTPSPLDEARFRRRFILKLLSSPLTLVPFLIGVTSLLGNWALNAQSGVAVFAGIAGILTAAGAAMTKMLLGAESLGKSVLDDIKEETREDREQALDKLERDLCNDGDSRTERYLRDLRALAKAFQEQRTKASVIQNPSIVEILLGVDQLFVQCIAALERSFNLFETAERMSSKIAREPILQQRDRIVEDVGKSVAQLGRILAGIQSTSGDGARSSDLASIRDELDQSLEAARNVERHIRSLDQEIESKISGK